VNFNEKYENIVNACGLAIFLQIFNFIGSSVIYLSLSEIPIWTHHAEAIRDKGFGTLKGGGVSLG
jgi:hypothetical protein